MHFSSAWYVLTTRPFASFLILCDIRSLSYSFVNPSQGSALHQCERFEEPMALSRPVTPLIPPSTMSSKRKWDQAAPESGPADGETPSKTLETEDGKTVSEAAAAAAAIAAKIAAQFSATAGAAPESIQIGQRPPRRRVHPRHRHQRHPQPLPPHEVVDAERGACPSPSCDDWLISPPDPGRHRRVDQHQGRVVSRQIQGHGERPSPVPPPLRLVQGPPPACHRQDQRPHRHGPRSPRRGQERPHARKGMFPRRT